jgi:hypothetical protein
MPLFADSYTDLHADLYVGVYTPVNANVYADIFASRTSPRTYPRPIPWTYSRPIPRIHAWALTRIFPCPFPRITPRIYSRPSSRAFPCAIPSSIRPLLLFTGKHIAHGQIVCLRQCVCPGKGPARGQSVCPVPSLPFYFGQPICLGNRIAFQANPLPRQTARPIRPVHPMAANI